MTVAYELLGRKDIGLIEPLWKELTRHHAKRSKHFKKRYRRFTFDERMQSLFGKVRGDLVHILAARDTENGKLIGYCIASVDYLGWGEIDSVYVAERHRKDGIGRELAGRCLAWLKKQKVSDAKLRIVVAVGNEEAFGFYEKLGFVESKYILEKKGT